MGPGELLPVINPHPRMEPIGIMWKTVSEDCNLACDYCYYSRIQGKIEGRVKRIDSALLEKFMKEYMALSTGGASFIWQGGEPLLAGLDFFEEVVRLEVRYAPPNTEISNAVQTNATLVTDEMAAFFKRYNFLVGVSLDGPREIHDQRRVSRAGRGSYDRVMEGLSRLRGHGVDVNILTVLHDGNVRRARDLLTFYAEEQFPYVQFIPAMDFRAQEPDKPPRYLITPEEYGAFMCEAFDIWYGDGNPTFSIRFFDNMLQSYLNREPDLCIHRSMCPTSLVLEQNGDAYPCDFYINDAHRLGNVGTDSFVDILRNHGRHRFLTLKPTLPEPCTSCEFLALCHGGCPRNRRWGRGETVDVDYFCGSYLQIYAYTGERMSRLATRIKQGWLEEYIREMHREPAAEAQCICGSGLSYGACCAELGGSVHASG